MKGYIMKQRIKASVKKGIKPIDFKRATEITVKSEDFETKKYVEVIYTKLPDAVKAYADEVEYEQRGKEFFIDGKQYAVVDGDEYVKANAKAEEVKADAN